MPFCTSLRTCLFSSPTAAAKDAAIVEIAEDSIDSYVLSGVFVSAYGTITAR
jgi:hypothetical protein